MTLRMPASSEARSKFSVPATLTEVNNAQVLGQWDLCDVVMNDVHASDGLGYARGVADVASEELDFCGAIVRVVQVKYTAMTPACHAPHKAGSRSILSRPLPTRSCSSFLHFGR